MPIVLRREKFFAAIGKCSFLKDSVLFLGYMVSKNGLAVNESKLEAIKQWPIPTTIHEVQSFPGLVSFYRRFIHNFSTIMAPITDCIKAGKCSWSEEVTAAFEAINEKLTTTLALALLDFSQPELHCDASKVGTRAVLSQGGKPVAYFNEKLSRSKLNYNTYDVDFYALVQALKYWNSYLANSEFILHLDHEALKHLQSQDKLSSRHAGWAAYIQQFSFVIKHKSGVLNKVADALSWKETLLTTMRTKVLEFDLFEDSLSTEPFLVLLLVMWQLAIGMIFFSKMRFFSKESVMYS